MPYEPIDNDEDILDFDTEKIEQTNPEFKICEHCHGKGMVLKGNFWFNCGVCHGTGKPVKEVKTDG